MIDNNFVIEKRGDKIHKWTMGVDSTYRLRKNCFKQMAEMKAHFLYPINTVEVLSFEESEDKFEFVMPYLEWETPADLINTNRLTFQISVINSFSNRMNKTHTGFQEICTNFLIKNIDILKDKSHKDHGLFPAQKIMALIDKSNDTYPHGYAHGDFTFSNMLVSPNEELFITNFDNSFIYSPLLDIASLSLSERFSGKDNQFQTKLVDRVSSHFLSYKNKIRVIKCLKMFEWLAHTDNLDFRAKLIKEIEDE